MEGCCCTRALRRGAVRGDFPMGAIQVILGKHLGLSLMGVFNGIRILGVTSKYIGKVCKLLQRPVGNRVAHITL